jgi:hypothetical protein
MVLMTASTITAPMAPKRMARIIPTRIRVAVIPTRIRVAVIPTRIRVAVIPTRIRVAVIPTRMGHVYLERDNSQSA